MKCIISGCEKNSSTRVSFHRLIRKGKLREDWVDAIEQLNGQKIDKSTDLKNSLICENHFEPKYVKNYGHKKYLSDDAIPTIFPKLWEEGIENVEFLSFIEEAEPSFGAYREHADYAYAQVEENFAGVLKENSQRAQSRKRPFNAEEATPRTLKRRYGRLEELLKKSKNALKVARRTILRKDAKIQSLTNVIKDLEKKNMLSGNASEVLQTFDNNFLKVLSNGKEMGKYPEDVRSFALTLHFYSPRAYGYIRSLTNENLPAPSTLRAWYSQTEVSAGFTQKALDVLTLKTIALERKGQKVVACLMMDEMAIRKHMQWDDARKKFIGTIDYGSDFSSNDELPLAKEALVYLLVGLNGAWKLPVAYFLSNGLSSSEKASLTRQVIGFLSSSKVEIVGLTFDGHASNIGMIKHLGATLKEFEPMFKNPDNNSNISIFLDACHCLKLIRNTWGTKKIFFDENGHAIKWSFIEKLVQYQGELGLHFANKLNNRHLNWHSKIMNVKIAAETLSESTSNALLFLLNRRVPGFEGCEATIAFLKKINDIFDCLNTKSKFGFGFKQGLNEINKSSVFQFFEDSIKYLSELKVGDEKLMNSKNKVGFIGFIIGMKNLKNLYIKYVEEKGFLSYILSYKLSQDHLELFFSSIRSRGGFNNNPTSTQFASAYKRLLIHNEVRSSAEANCISFDDTNILVASSSTVSRKKEYGDEVCEKEVMIFEGVSDNHLRNSPLEEIILYISGFVEYKILKTLQCKKCKEFLITSVKEQSSLISIKSKGFLRYPHKDTLKICKLVQTIIGVLETQNKLTSGKIFTLITSNTFRKLDYSSIYIDLDNHVLNCDALDNHKYNLIRAVIEQCSKVLLHYIAKKSNLDEHKKLVRSRLTKTVQFMGQ